MLLDKLKPCVPHVVAVLLFVVISLLYFPSLLEGKRIKQHDILMHKGMSKEIADYRAKTGKEPLWTNSMFGGMPAYQISVLYKNNVSQYINEFIGLRMQVPARFLFVSLLGFYILLLAFKLDVWVAFAGALAFGFSSYFFIIDSAGHNSKAMAMALMSPIIAGGILAYRGKYLLGGALLALFLALQLNANHLQVTYYTFLILLIFGILEFAMSIKNKELPNFAKATAVLIVAALLAVGPNITNLLVTDEYGHYSTRGTSELSSKSGDQTTGLDKSYILGQYSYGIGETFNLFIPNFVGGKSYGELGTNSATYKILAAQYPDQARNYIKQMPLYWGGQYQTAGPVYLGAVVMFLFVLGLFAVRGKLKWWLVAATILSIGLAWGKNLEFLSNIFIDYFPGYNKFRTVSMILIIAEFTVPLLGFLGLWKMFSTDLNAESKLKALRNATAIVGGFALFFVILPGIFLNFEGTYDGQLKWPAELLDALRQDRKSLLQADAFRSLVFVLLSAGVIWAYLKNKVTVRIAAVAFSVLILADLGFAGKRYLNDDNYTSLRESQNPFEPSQADLAVLQDNTLDYRVINITVDPFNDASTSYLHKSIGGYHGAKLKRFQELVDYHIGAELQSITTVLSSKQTTTETIDSVLALVPVLNMMNTKYLIYHTEAPPLLNKHALGNAWYVRSYQWVKNADEEILALKGFNPGKVAIVDQRYKNDIASNFAMQPDTAATIQLLEYEPNRLLYKTNAKTAQIAVFAEVFYDKGWNAYVDGKLTPHFRADYLLRAMVVPAGEHSIEYRFEPTTYYTGEKIALASSIMLVLLVLGAFSFEVYKRVKA